MSQQHRVSFTRKKPSGATYRPCTLVVKPMSQAMFTNGVVIVAGDWIKLHRKLLDSPLFHHAGLLHLWMYCLLHANWKPTKWRIPGTFNELPINRGQFVTSLKTLHR